MNHRNDHFINNSYSYVQIEPGTVVLKKEDKNLFLGSCFAENLYNYYNKNYIDSFFSPFGNIYNPMSLASSLKLLCNEEKIKEEEIFKHKGLWRHFAFDSELCRINKSDFLNSINDSLEKGQTYIKKTDNLILTLGTSFVFKNIITDEIVNNCHKLPANRFHRENTSIEIMNMALSEALNKVRKINKNINIIMTLSPVRHLRDNASENSLSKSRLRCLIDELGNKFELWYFPAYEILLDQLRDYRWYSDDLAHPTDKAVDYIMERFIESSADMDFKSYLKEISNLNNSLNHRILHPDTEEAVKFISNTNTKFQQIVKKYPAMTKLKNKYDSHFSGKQSINNLL